MQPDPQLQLVNQIAQTIYDRKGFNIIAIDLRGISTVTDFFLIAEGNIDRHLHAISKEIRTVLAQEVNLKPLFVDNDEAKGWVVLDYADIMIHLFISEVRQRYRLEELWNEGKIIDLELQIKLEE